ncbi:MAG TPA: YhdP family protein, partial [Rhodocyclaceae bacterium]|nr:YhdP family protein [Rhodocyclaceae bacterium]
ATRDATIDLPKIFSEARITVDVLDARLAWKMVGGAAEVNIEGANFKNADAEGSASGRYRGDGKAAGFIDLTARVSRGAGDAVWRYMPLVVSKDARDWLRRSLVGGTAAATLRLQGDLDRFPFTDGSGVFEVKGTFAGAGLRYAPDWPPFEDVSGALEFVGPSMVIRAQKARLWDVNLSDVRAEVPDLGSSQPTMTVTGAARGPTADFLRFIEASPVGGRIDHFTEDMKATGTGELRLKLEMPLRHVAETGVDGTYRFAGDTLMPDPDVPPLVDVIGELHFTADRLEARKIRASALGAPLLVDVATTADGKVAVKAAGTMTVRGLRQQFNQPWFDHLSGGAPWSATVQVKGRNAEVRLESSLTGISSSLPEPFNKTATEAMPFVFERGAAPRAETARGRRPATDGVARDQVAVSLGNALRAQLIRRHDNGKITVERGVVDVGRTEARLPERGVLLAVQMKRLDADFWRRLAGGGDGLPLPVGQVDVRADELVAFGRTVNAFRLAGAAEGSLWKLDLKSREASGRLEWNGDGAGRISGRLAQVAIPEGQGAGEDAGRDAGDDLPAIDLAIDHLLLKGKDLGEMKLAAENRDKAWNAKFELKNDDATFAGEGRWRPIPSASETRLDFTLVAKSVEKTLTRYGYPDAMKEGSALLSGSLGWSGPPQAMDYPTLSGNLKLEAKKGQFKKMDPGVGRLLGILSLQSLPRRLTLDFKDIFSEGFAFDSIGGQFAISRGVIETKDLQIQGPAARILMKGSVSLPQESQNLRVRVQPALGETLSVGLLIGAHPVAGAIGWIADKVLKDPLGQIFSYEYSVTGGWAD